MQTETKARCVDCGGEFVKHAYNHVRCPECVKKRNREMDRLRKAKQRADKRLAVDPLDGRTGKIKKKSNAKYCKDCKYYDTVIPCCDYLLKAGQRRGCEAGKNCTRKEKRK